MVPRTTRLEYSIVAIALLVLLFCSKPPKSGTASVNRPEEAFPVAIEAEDQMTTEPEMGLGVGADETESQAVEETPAETETEEVVPEEPPVLEPLPVPTFTSGAAPVRTEQPSQPTKKLATVDARNSGKLNYNDIMQGEVSVRWVWNGQKFVPRKVCVVKEPNGVTSVWSFDNQDGTVLREIE